MYCHCPPSHVHLVLPHVPPGALRGAPLSVPLPPPPLISMLDPCVLVPCATTTDSPPCTAIARVQASCKSAAGSSWSPCLVCPSVLPHTKCQLCSVHCPSVPRPRVQARRVQERFKVIMGRAPGGPAPAALTSDYLEGDDDFDEGGYDSDEGGRGRHYDEEEEVRGREDGGVWGNCDEEEVRGPG